MGYTNYWTQKKPFNNIQWNTIKKEYDYIKENFSDDDGIIEDQTEKSDEIIFNGKSKDNLDHETFVLTKNFRKPFYSGDDVKFNFCKTARKPYDLAVWHLLTFVKMIAPNSIEIKRDGWYNGRKENN
jgi:hypothetical protein